MGKIKNIAIVTGATGGIGREFVKNLQAEVLDEIWVIGRDEGRLSLLQEELGEHIIPICRDLTDRRALSSFAELLKEEQVKILWLINNAGMAKMQASKEFNIEEIEQTIALNCKVPVILINMCIPFMGKGSKILNISSASAFQPVPYINLYAATKAFERSYSRGLHVELQTMGITVTAVCPSWVDTRMLTKEINGKRIKFKGMVSPQKVVKKAIMDAKKGRDMSVCSFYVKCQHLNVKLMPQKLTMKLWMHDMKKYM